MLFFSTRIFSYPSNVYFINRNKNKNIFVGKMSCRSQKHPYQLISMKDQRRILLLKSIEGYRYIDLLINIFVSCVQIFSITIYAILMIRECFTIESVFLEYFHGQKITTKLFLDTEVIIYDAPFALQ